VDILASLPDFRGKDVMDIGAGIGYFLYFSSFYVLFRQFRRFTTVFAESAKRVISTDFIESFIEKNKERNSVFSNVDYHVSDAIGLDFPSESTDFIFTNWLLMYLGHEEAIQLVQKALQWLRPGGHMHIRESCSGPSTSLYLLYNVWIHKHRKNGVYELFC
jgi:phosphoethanolamine N-methyltransferase